MFIILNGVNGVVGVPGDGVVGGDSFVVALLAIIAITDPIDGGDDEKRPPTVAGVLSKRSCS